MTAKLRVLIVDDSSFSRSVLSNLIRAGTGDRCEITEAANGTDALEHVSGTTVPFDLVTLDLQMPGQDGISIATTLREQGCRSKLALITANVQANVRSRAETLALDFIPKPLNPDKVSQLLKGVGIAGAGRD
jgi:two-component system, LytTR family, response regulator AlgR